MLIRILVVSLYYEINKSILDQENKPGKQNKNRLSTQ